MDNLKLIIQIVFFVRCELRPKKHMTI